MMSVKKSSPHVRFDDANTASVIDTDSETETENTVGTPSNKDTFNTGKVAFTPKINNVAYKNVDEREKTVVAPQGSLMRPNYEDNLRRVSVVLQQHIMKCQYLMARSPPRSSVPPKPKTFSSPAKPLSSAAGLFHTESIDKFNEENFLIPKYTYQFVHSPITRVGLLYGVVPVKHCPKTPTLAEIHKFLFDLFVKAHLTAECSIGINTNNPYSNAHIIVLR
jgi:hypothetical protein